MNESVPYVLTQVDGHPCAWIAGDNTIHVVGESYYQEHLQRVVGVVGTHKPFAVWLIPEPNNPHDSNAVAVYVGAGKIGHLPRMEAEKWQWALIELEKISRARAACSATLFETESNAPWVKGGSLIEAYLRVPFPPSRPSPVPQTHAVLPGTPSGLLSVGQVYLDAKCPTCGMLMRVQLDQLDSTETRPCFHPFTCDPADLLAVSDQLRKLAGAIKTKTRPKRARLARAKRR